jgi:uncharacterized protein (DUF736 family)
MQVGALSRVTGESGEGYTGNITTALFAGGVALAPNTKRGAAAPDFRVKVKTNGRWMECGAAWRKPSDKVLGGEFLSITIDHAGMSKPLYVTAFPVDGQKPKEIRDLNIIWKRTRGTMGGGPRAAAPIGGAEDGDEVPF